jgi:hypothetical protein
MELRPPVRQVSVRNTSRLIPSRFPPAGILDLIATPEDLAAITEVEAWTNDRISSELGLLMTIPRAEWVVGTPHASVVMAAYCHPHPEGGRFNDAMRGAWYAALSLETAIAETVYHRTRWLEEIGVFETRVEMRQYLADFDCTLHDARATPDYDALHDPASYAASQALAGELLAAGSNGIFYRSVRHVGGECIACFRPRLVLNVRPAAHYEYRWEGRREPRVTEMAV